MKTLPHESSDDVGAEACRAMQDMLDIVGRRWTGAVLLACTRGASRSGEIRHMVTGISDRLLSQRLKELESLGLVDRAVVPTTPVQILYRPTARAEELVAALGPLVAWGARYLP